MDSALVRYQREKVCGIALTSLLLLNCFDLVSTMILWNHGLIHEGNPLMDIFIKTDPNVFAFSKLFLCYFGISILWFYKSVEASKNAALILLGFYLLVCMKHIHIMIVC